MPEPTTENDRDMLFSEVAEIWQMVQHLTRDIDAGKEPDGPHPRVYREDRGKRMTLKVARRRLHHVEVRLKALAAKAQ